MGRRSSTCSTMPNRRSVVRRRPLWMGEVPLLPRPPDGTPGLLREPTPPSVRIQPRGEFLHAVGPAGVLAALQELLEPELGPLRFSLSRLDLFVDVQGWWFGLEDAPRFVCRANARRPTRWPAR